MNGELERLEFIPLQTKLIIRVPPIPEGSLHFPNDPPTVVETNTNTALLFRRIIQPKYYEGDPASQHLPVNKWVFSGEGKAEFLSSINLTFLNGTFIKSACQSVLSYYNEEERTKERIRLGEDIMLCNRIFFFNTLN